MTRPLIVTLHTVLGLLAASEAGWALAVAAANGVWERTWGDGASPGTWNLALAASGQAAIALGLVGASVLWLLGSTRAGWAVVALTPLLAADAPWATWPALAVGAVYVTLDVLVLAHRRARRAPPGPPPR